MRVDLLLILRLDNKDHLHRHEIVCVVTVRKHQCGRRVDTELRRVLENVRDRVFAINLLLHDTVLIDTDGCEDIQHRLVHRLQTIDDERDGDPLPAWNAYKSLAWAGFLRCGPTLFL